MSSIMRRRSALTVVVLLMESSIPSEVDDTSILRKGLFTPTAYPRNWLPVRRLAPPRSGLERSRFVPWPKADVSRLDSMGWISQDKLPKRDRL